MNDSPTRAQTEAELEGLVRLGAARAIADYVLSGHADPDDSLLDALAELVEQAARFFALAGKCRQ